MVFKVSYKPNHSVILWHSNVPCYWDCNNLHCISLTRNICHQNGSMVKSLASNKGCACNVISRQQEKIKHSENESAKHEFAASSVAVSPCSPEWHLTCHHGHTLSFRFFADLYPNFAQAGLGLVTRHCCLTSTWQRWLSKCSVLRQNIFS